MKTGAFSRARLGLSIIVAIFLIGVIPSVVFSGGGGNGGDGNGDVAPIVTGISPRSSWQGRVVKLTISGFFFSPGDKVSFVPSAGINVTSVEFLSPTKLEVTINIDIKAREGPSDVVVTNPWGLTGSSKGAFRVEPAPLPPPITGLAASDLRGGTVELTWNQSQAHDFAYYAVYVSIAKLTDVTGLPPIARITDITASKYRVTGLEIGTTYYLAVTAVDTFGAENKNVTAQSMVPTSTLLLSLPPLISPDTLVSLPAVLAGFVAYFLVTRGKKAAGEAKVTEVKVNIELLRRKSLSEGGGKMI